MAQVWSTRKMKMMFRTRSGFCAIKSPEAAPLQESKQRVSSFAQESQQMCCTNNAIYLEMMCLFLSKPANFI